MFVVSVGPSHPILTPRPAAMQRLAGVPLLGQHAAKHLDVDLMQRPGFSIHQLMELAGLSVACAVPTAYPADTHRRVLVVAGPGNNGGDGLVAARHLTHFAYNVQVVYPKQPSRELFANLRKQCDDVGVEFVDMPASLAGYDVVVDALFGFSFHGSLRAPFDDIVAAVADGVAGDGPALVCVDVPSGWDVESGPPSDGTPVLRPDMLVSLSAPKQCSAEFEGDHHVLGGRFLPPWVVEKYGLWGLPKYPGTEQVVRLP